MAGADFSASQVGWFIVAGFILGFATSTLWEWLYYRQKRRAQIEAAALAVLPTIRADSLPNPAQNPVDESADLQPAEPWGTRYRGSGIYLESEQTAAGQAESTPDDEPATSPLSTADIDDELGEAEGMGTLEHLAAPRLNPATLAALQAAVAESPIAHSTPQTRIYPTPPAREPSEPSDAPPNGHATDEIHVREITSYPPPSTNTLSPENQGIAQRVDGDNTAVKVVEMQSALPAVQPPNRTHRAADYPDDLALIKGVGEAYKRRLYAAGVYTWRQVAESDIESLRRITRAKPNANIEDWHAQAQALAEKYQRWHTTFQGPLDDFMQIDGIGAITADTLYKAGFCTYEQLAAALPDELAKIVPAPTVGNENDFDGWINRAVQLANEKRRNLEARA